MSSQTIGTCGNCGGPVQVPMYWGGTIPPAATCASCGARAKQSYGPIITMEGRMAQLRPDFNKFGAGEPEKQK